MIPQSLMETNVYTVRGKVLVVGSCLPQVFPVAYEKLTAEADQVYSLCLETTHINMAITMHYIMHEIERTLKDHVSVKNFVVIDGKIISVSEKAIDLSKSLSKLSAMG